MGAPKKSKIFKGKLNKVNTTSAEAAVTQAKNNPDRENFRIYYVIFRLADSHLALWQGDYDRVIALTDEFLMTWRPSGMRAHIPDILTLQGQALLAQGQKAQAWDRRQEARLAAKAINSRRSLWPILSALSRLETDLTKAQHLRRQAREIVETIAGYIGISDLRMSFLHLPEVQALLAAPPDAED